MTIALQDIAWHRSVAQLIEALDRPNFWAQLVRLLNQYVSFDSWVVLQFSSGQRPLVFAESPRLFHTRNPFAFGGVYEDPATGASSARRPACTRAAATAPPAKGLVTLARSYGVSGVATR